MSKAILVMDMPKSCSECRLVFLEQCFVNTHPAHIVQDVNAKPKWCPLREVPQKIGINEAAEMKRFGCIADIINSYNACIDEILRDKEREDE